MADRNKFDNLDPSQMIAEMREEYWRGLAAGEDDAADDRLQLLLMEIGKERFALDADFCRTITKAGRLTRLPRMPAFVLGVINLRGEIISVVDLGLLFGLGAREQGPKARFVVLEGRGSRVACLADRIFGIEWISAARVREPQAGGAGLKNEYVKGHLEPSGDDPWAVYIDVPRLLAGPELSFQR